MESTDNGASVDVMNSKRSKSAPMLAALRIAFEEMMRAKIDIFALYVKSSDNTIADKSAIAKLSVGNDALFFI